MRGQLLNQKHFQWLIDSLLLQRYVSAAAVRNLRRPTGAFAQRRVRVNRLADVHRVRTHLDGQGNLTNHVACMRADHAVVVCVQCLY